MTVFVLSCDEKFHGHECKPVQKLHREVRADFEENDQDTLYRISDGRSFVPVDDITQYDITLVGGQVVDGSRGCGTVHNGNSVYFGAVRPDCNILAFTVAF